VDSLNAISNDTKKVDGMATVIGRAITGKCKSNRSMNNKSLTYDNQAWRLPYWDPSF
jgi:hypothetical protein